MKNIKVGDIIVDRDGDEAKVLEVLPNKFLRSSWFVFEVAGGWYTYEEAKACGYKIKGEDTIRIIDGKRYRLIEE